MTNEHETGFAAAVDRFFMAPRDLRILDVVRRGYGILLLLYVGLLWPDRHLFFGKGSYLPVDAAREVIDPDVYSLYSFFPDTPLTITLALALLVAGALAMLIGWIPRIAAATTFVLLVLVQHANDMLFDGEDIIFRLFAFFLIFVPPWRKLKSLARREHSSLSDVDGYPAWPLRLFQLQICLVYFCTAIQKSNGLPWLDGTAIYYALRLDDMTKFPLPGAITESIGWLKILTWSTLVLEFMVPVLIWGKRTRWLCIGFAVLFHLGTDYAMNLFLFHWIMMLGLISFVRYDELQAIGRWITSWFSKPD
jgi:hypothetical protein